MCKIYWRIYSRSNVGNWFVHLYHYLKWFMSLATVTYVAFASFPPKSFISYNENIFVFFRQPKSSAYNKASAKTILKLLYEDAWKFTRHICRRWNEICNKNRETLCYRFIPLDRMLYSIVVPGLVSSASCDWYKWSFSLEQPDCDHLVNLRLLMGH